MKMQKGLTLIEIIIYVAILGLIATSFISMSINIMSLKTKSVAQQEVNSALRFISQKINYEIRNAKSISSVTASGFTLITADNLRNPTVFDLYNGNLRMGFGNSGSCPATNPCILNNHVVNISGFIVNNLSSGDSKTQNIEYTITANYKNNSGRYEFNAFGSVSNSAEIRSR